MLHEQEKLFEQLIALREYTLVDPTKFLVRKEDEWIQFFLCNENKLDMSYFYKSYERIEPAVTHLIFIFTHATIQIKKLKMYKDILRMEFFSAHELSRLLTGNRLIPRHQQVDPQTRDEILRKFKPDDLPNLLQTDPIARLYDFPVDSIVEIHRPDSLYFRLVIPDENA